MPTMPRKQDEKHQPEKLARSRASFFNKGLALYRLIPTDLHCRPFGQQKLVDGEANQYSKSLVYAVENIKSSQGSPSSPL